MKGICLMTRAIYAVQANISTTKQKSTWVVPLLKIARLYISRPCKVQDYDIYLVSRSHPGTSLDFCNLGYNSFFIFF